MKKFASFALALSLFAMTLAGCGGSSSAAPAASLAAGEPVKAPMPGVVLKVQVQQGQAVKAGQVLVILEAMKMENEIVAPKDGTVAQIVAAKGASVESGAPLVILA